MITAQCHPEEYKILFAEQYGVCAICGQTEPREHLIGAQVLVGDHGHETVQIRDLICNRALGLSQDNPMLLQKVLDYLIAANEVAV